MLLKSSMSTARSKTTGFYNYIGAGLHSQSHRHAFRQLTSLMLKPNIIATTVSHIP